MKYSVVVSSVFVLNALAQFPADFPSCGSTCIGNMLGLAPSLGCPTADPACLCSNGDFANGVRDCSNAACGSSSDAESVISYGTQYCSSALAGGAGSDATGSATTLVTSVVGNATATQTGEGASSAITTSAILSTITNSAGEVITSTVGSTTIFAGAGGAGEGSSAITTSAIVSTITNSAGDVVTSTVGSTTIFAGAGGSASASASDALESASSVASDISSSASEAISSATDSAGNAIDSATSSAGDAAGSATETSTAGAPRQTAGALFGAVVGIAAMVL